MTAKDAGAGKYTGQNYSGSSPQDFGGLKQAGSYEYMGVHKSAPNPTLSVESGSGTSEKTGDVSKGLNTHAAGYAGPQNWTPDNRGVVNPDDIHH